MEAHGRRTAQQWRPTTPHEADGMPGARRRTDPAPQSPDLEDLAVGRTDDEGRQIGEALENNCEKRPAATFIDADPGLPAAHSGRAREVRWWEGGGGGFEGSTRVARERATAGGYRLL